MPVRVHPHLRGEHARSGYDTRAGLGSSPPAWGTRLPVVEWQSGLRFIPTRVGNTTCSAVMSFGS